MRELVEVELGDGRVLWASVEAPDHRQGPRDSDWPEDAGLDDHPGPPAEPPRRLREIQGFTEILEWAGRSLVTGLDRAGTGTAEGLRRVRPGRITVEFAVDLAVGRTGLVAVLGGVSGKAAVKVTMSWGDTEPGPPGAVAAPAESGVDAAGSVGAGGAATQSPAESGVDAAQTTVTP